VWKELKDEIRASQRYRLTTVIGFILLSLFFIPWNTRITTPAILQATNKVDIHSVGPGVIKEIFVKEGDEISAGQPILVLDSPSLRDEIARTERQYEVTELRSKRRASNISDLSNMQVVLQQLQELRSRLNGLYEMREELIIRSPMHGSLVDMENNLHPGRWINTKLRIAHVVQLDDFILQGVIAGKNLAQVKVDQKATFIPDEPELDTVEAKVVEIEDANIQVMDTLYFASIYGGEVAVREDKEKGLVPEESLYRIKFQPVNPGKVIPSSVKVMKQTGEYSRL